MAPIFFLLDYYNLLNQYIMRFMLQWMIWVYYEVYVAAWRMFIFYYFEIREHVSIFAKKLLLFTIFISILSEIFFQVFILWILVDETISVEHYNASTT